MIPLETPASASALVGDKVVLVVTKVDLVAQRVGLSRDEVIAQLSKIGDVVDVPGNIADQQDVRDFISQEASKRNVSAIQIIGDYNIIRSNLISNPANDSDIAIDTDDLYADFNGDNKADIPIARLPLGTNSDIWKAQFKRIVNGYAAGDSRELINPVGGRRALWVEVANAIGTDAQVQESLPVTLPDNPAALPRDAYITAILLHGDNKDTAQWWGEEPEYPAAMDMAHADFDGIVYSAACYGAYINGKTQVDSLSLNILRNGAQCFIGSTGTSYSASGLIGNTVIPITMSRELNNGRDPLTAYYTAKMSYYELDKTECNLINMKMRLQYQYYGLVPPNYWKENPLQQASSPQTTSLVFDVSGSMDDLSGANSLRKIEAAKAQGAAFVNSIRALSGIGNYSPQIGIVSFSTNAWVEHDLTADYSSLAGAINSMVSVNMTNIKAGIDTSIRQLEGVAGDKVMVLLSDGYDTETSYSEIMQSAQAAKDKGITIYTIGFGLPGDLDTDLLEDIAALTGGSYSYQDSSSLMSSSVGLFGDLIRNQLAQDFDILVDSMGTVAQGETVEAGSFEITENGDLQTFLYWPGSELDLELVDPEGTIVEEGYAGYTLDDSNIPVLATISNTSLGVWTMRVRGIDVSMAEEPYYAIAAFSETEAPQTVAAGGGAQDDGSGLLIILVIAAVLAIGGVFALSIRNKNNGSDQDTGVLKP
jgi:hypothetical protein